MRRPIALGLLALCAACAGGEEAVPPGCEIEETSIVLPPQLNESSGIALSRTAQGLLWTHNDSGDGPVVYLTSLAGELRGAVRLEGARNRDWEDMAVGPCDAGSCLYVADIGDNQGVHDEVYVYRVPEPGLGATSAGPAERIALRYPDGPRDAEALFVLPSGEVFLISKGRGEPVEVFRVPPPAAPGEARVLERVATLMPTAQDVVLQVTGADASPNGEWVAVRAYRELMLHRTADLVAGDGEPALVVDLSPVGEVQGEAVALADDGTVILSSEGVREVPASLSRLRCTLPER